MFLWTKPQGRRAFGTTAEFAEATKVLAANQGLYNGFLAAGLIWALILGVTGAGHSIAGLVVSGNVFRAMLGNIDRIESVNTSFASFEEVNYRHLVFEGYAFNGVTQITASPLTM